MSKVLVQKIITTTLELNETEIKGLLLLLNHGTSAETIEKLGLSVLYKQLFDNQDLIKEKANFSSMAVLGEKK